MSVFLESSHHDSIYFDYFQLGNCWGKCKRLVLTCIKLLSDVGQGESCNLIKEYTLIHAAISTEFDPAFPRCRISGREQQKTSEMALFRVHS